MKLFGLGSIILQLSSQTRYSLSKLEDHTLIKTGLYSPNDPALLGVHAIHLCLATTIITFSLEGNSALQLIDYYDQAKFALGAALGFYTPFHISNSNIKLLFTHKYNYLPGQDSNPSRKPPS